MVNFFSIMINASSIIAMVAMLIVFVGILFKNPTISNVDTFNNCNEQIKVCRISSIVFSILYWFVVSGFPTKECLEGYVKLAAICYRLGSIWIVLAFVNVVISIILSITRRGRDEIEIMRKLRSSCFFLGAIFLFFDFILKVN